MVLELKDKLAGVESAVGGDGAVVIGPALSALERDVLSALQNLGCSRPAAEEAVRKVKERGAPEEFEPFFRTAMGLMR
jgi:Holliday junction resolvasome RuvABC DNA-binding subunit